MSKEFDKTVENGEKTKETYVKQPLSFEKEFFSKSTDAFSRIGSKEEAEKRKDLGILNHESMIKPIPRSHFEAKEHDNPVAEEIFEKLFCGIRVDGIYDFSEVSVTKLERILRNYKYTTDAMGNTILFWACRNDFVWLVDFLVRRLGYDPEVKNTYGKTCKFYASSKEVVDYFTRTEKENKDEARNYSRVFKTSRAAVVFFERDELNKKFAEFSKINVPEIKETKSREKTELDESQLLSHVKAKSFSDIMVDLEGFVGYSLIKKNEAEMIASFFKEKKILNGESLSKYFRFPEFFKHCEKIDREEVAVEFKEFMERESVEIPLEGCKKFIENFCDLLHFEYFDITKWGDYEVGSWIYSYIDKMVKEDETKETREFFEGKIFTGKEIATKLFFRENLLSMKYEIKEELFTIVDEIFSSFRNKKNVFTFEDIGTWISKLNFFDRTMNKKLIDYVEYLKKSQVISMFRIDEKEDFFVFSHFWNKHVENAKDRELFFVYLDHLRERKCWDGMSWYNIAFCVAKREGGIKENFHDKYEEFFVKYFVEFEEKFGYLEKILEYCNGPVSLEAMEKKPPKIMSFVEDIKLYQSRLQQSNEEFLDDRAMRRVESFKRAIHQQKVKRDYLYGIKFWVNPTKTFSLGIGPLVLEWGNDVTTIEPNTIFSVESYYVYGVDSEAKTIMKAVSMEEIVKSFPEISKLCQRYNAGEFDGSENRVYFLEKLLKIFSVTLIRERKEILLKFCQINSERKREKFYCPVSPSYVKVMEKVDKQYEYLSEIEGDGWGVIEFNNHVELDTFIDLILLNPKDSFFYMLDFILMTIDRAYWIKYKLITCYFQTYKGDVVDICEPKEKCKVESGCKRCTKSLVGSCCYFRDPSTTPQSFKCSIAEMRSSWEW